MTDHSIYIVCNGVRYRLVEGRDCTNHCSFRKADGPYYCERGCCLPRWIKRLGISVDFWLERVDAKDAELRATRPRGSTGAVLRKGKEVIGMSCKKGKGGCKGAGKGGKKCGK